jgi:hypothetical protein
MSGEEKAMAGKKRPRSLAAEQAAVAWRRKLFDEGAMGGVVAALRRGATITAAAREAGFARETVNAWRRRAAHFDEACRAALDKRGERLVRSVGPGTWALRRPRYNAFTAARKTLYLDHFAATGDRIGAAAAAGVCLSTVSNHRRNDPVFAEAYSRALALALEDLEAAAVANRMAAMTRLEFDPARATVTEAGGGDPGAEFDRTLALLREHRKTPAKTGRPPGLCSFEDGFAALERELNAFDAREGRDGDTTGPLHQPPAGPPPRTGEDLGNG